MRRVVKSLALPGVRYGVSSKVVEAWLMQVTRRLVAVHKALGIAETVEEWLTADMVTKAFQGEFPSAPEADPSESAVGAFPAEAKVVSRAYDKYISKNREVLSEEAASLPGGGSLGAKVKRLGLRKFRVLDSGERLCYIAAAREESLRRRNLVTGRYECPHSNVPEDADLATLKDVTRVARRRPLPRLRHHAKHRFSEGVVDGLVRGYVGSDYKTKALLRRVFVSGAKAAGMAFRTARRWFSAVHARDWHGGGLGKKGRPKGTRMVGDAELYTKLAAVSQDMTKWSRKLSAPAKCLPGSLRSVFHAHESLHTSLSYRSLAKRTRLGRLAIHKGARRLDICSVCAVFDRQLGPSITRLLQEILSTLQGILPTYFEEWEKVVKARSEWQQPGFAKQASPQYLSALQAFMRDHRTKANLRSTLTDEEQQRLMEVEDTLTTRLQEAITTLEGFSVHWKVRDRQAAELQKVRTKNLQLATSTCIATFRSPSKVSLFLKNFVPLDRWAFV